MKKIAIIGGGISGIASAWYLQSRYEVTLFEGEPVLGGHTTTAMIDWHGKTLPIDMGFIVFNDRTYPHFMALLKAWGVSYAKSDMSFSLVSELSGLEYNGGNLNGLFADRLNLFRPTFWRLLAEIARFNRLAKASLADLAHTPELTLGELISQWQLSEKFTQTYLYPMAAAIWSGSLQSVSLYSAYFLLKFYDNHGLLDLSNRPQWYFIERGSQTYIKHFTRLFQGNMRANAPVTSIKREAGKVIIFDQAGQPSYFDGVVLACHADQALQLLSDPRPVETDILKAFPYEQNEVVLHNDIKLMPGRRRAWASWNYRLVKEPSHRPSLTYYMNKLQNVSSTTPFLVTLNPAQPILAPHVFVRRQMAHPQFHAHSLSFQSRWTEINGPLQTYYCGAYWGYGFHEDGVRSALAVSEAIKI